MDSIIISVPELLAKAQQLSSEKMNYVKLTINEAEDDIPASVAFTAISNLDDFSSTDYEEIEAAAVKGF